MTAVVTEVQSFSGPQVTELAEISYRQVDYWARTNVVVPSITVARGSGSQRRYSLADVHKARVVAFTGSFATPRIFEGYDAAQLCPQPDGSWPDGQWLILANGEATIEHSAELDDPPAYLVVNLSQTWADLLGHVAELQARKPVAHNTPSKPAKPLSEYEQWKASRS